MPETQKTTAIVLRRQPWREHDSRVLVYSLEHGLLDLVVRGTKRVSSKLVGHIEPLNLSQLMIISGKQYNYVGGASVIRAYPSLKTNYEYTKIASLVAKDLIKIIKPGISDKYIFDLFSRLLLILDQERLIIDLLIFKQIFLLKIISHLGFRPELTHCVIGKEKIQKENIFFQTQLGGLACASHVQGGSKIPITFKEVELLKMFITDELDKITKCKIDDKTAKVLSQIIQEFYIYHC